MTRTDIFFIEDDLAVRLGSTQALELADLTVTSFTHVEAALPFLRTDLNAVIVSDVRLPGLSGLDLLARVQEIDSGLPVILITGHGDIDMAVSAIRSGAYDFLEKPFTSVRLVETCRRALEKRRLVLENRRLRLSIFDRPQHPIVGRSEAMASIRTLVSRLATSPAPVIIHGAPGTGKEVVARAIHQSVEKPGAMISVQCGETGDSQAISAAFEQILEVGQGTLFLDAVERLSLHAQTCLIGCLGTGDIGVSRGGLRILAATTLSPDAFRASAAIRRELLFRLNLAQIELPPLKDRREDIPDLAEFFLRQAAMRLGVAAPDLDPATLGYWAGQEWPDNVRELANAVERFALGIPERDVSQGVASNRERGLAAQMDAVERSIIEAELRRTAGNISQAADHLGIPKKTLYDKMYRLKINNPKGQVQMLAAFDGSEQSRAKG